MMSFRECEGESFSDNDVFNYANTIAGKVSENTTVMNQISKNEKEQAMLGGFPKAIKTAIIESMRRHKDMANKILSDDVKEKDFTELMFDVLMKKFKKGVFLNK